MKWEMIKLYTLIDKPISGEWGDSEGNIKVIRSTNFTNDGTLDLSDVVLRSVAQKKVEQKQLKFGDIIIEKSGGSPTQPVGRVVHFLERGEVYLCNNFTSVLRPKSMVNARYLFWCLLSGHFKGSTLKYQNKTTGIINLQLERYCNEFEVPLPPLKIQEQIANTLDKADELRKKDQELLQKYYELAQAIFYDMFGDPVRNEKGWVTKKLKDCVLGKAGIKAGPFGSSLKKEFYTKTGYKIYGQEQVIADELNSGNYFISEEKYKELESCKVEAGDVLISMVGTFGKISVIPEVFQPGIINPRLVKLTLDKSKLLPNFFKCVFKMPETKKALSTVSRGGTMDIINAGILKEFATILPPIQLQESFLYKLNKLNQSILSISLQQTNALYSRIMLQTFS